MNELLFLIHLTVVLFFTMISVRNGRHALVAWICLQAIFANFFVLKQISLFGLTVTCSDVFAVGSFFGLNLLQEFYGKDIAKKTTKSCFYFMLFFVILSQIHLLYQPAPEDVCHPAYAILLSTSPRLLSASLLSFFLTQKLDVYLFSYLKHRKKPLPLTLRNTLCLFCSQLFDTILFTYLGLYGLISSPLHLILISFTLKIFLALLFSPIGSLLKNQLQRKHLP